MRFTLFSPRCFPYSFLRYISISSLRSRSSSGWMVNLVKSRFFSSSSETPSKVESIILILPGITGGNHTSSLAPSLSSSWLSASRTITALPLTEAILSQLAKEDLISAGSSGTSPSISNRTFNSSITLLSIAAQSVLYGVAPIKCIITRSSGLMLRSLDTQLARSADLPEPDSPSITSPGPSSPPSAYLSSRSKYSCLPMYTSLLLRANAS